MSRSVKIYVIEDNGYKIDYISQEVNHNEEIPGRVYKRNEIIEMIKEGKYEFVLLDYTGYEKEGEKILKHMKLKTIKTPVVIFTNPKEKHNIILTQKNFTTDNIGRSEDPNALINAIRKILLGENNNSN